MFDDGDILLFTLSAWREASWTAFKRSFDELHRRQAERTGASDQGDAASFRWRTLRMFMCLGHVDVSFEDVGTVVVGSPSLVALPGPGVRRAVLCGARSPAFIDKVRTACSTSEATLSIQSQGHFYPFAPTHMEVQGESDDQIQSVANLIGASYLSKPPARTIAKWAGSLSEYLKTLNWVPDDGLNWYREDYDPVSLRFLEPTGNTATTRLGRYQDPVKTIWRYRLYRDGTFAAINPDWGRYAILSTQGRQVFEFDMVNRSVLVPTRAPLPALFSRALALCSGYSPRTGRRDEKMRGVRSMQYDQYVGIPPSVFQMVASKLGQNV